MKHADMIIERVLTLDALPNLQDLGKLNIGEDVPEILASDKVSEETNQKLLNKRLQLVKKRGISSHERYSIIF